MENGELQVLCFGTGFLVLTAIQLISGKTMTNTGRLVDRRSDPALFWYMVGLTTVCGVFALCLLFLM
jgi:hypothetical protein